eukprot:NODE_261_length_1790_cov_102.780517_g234_i0.p1 GENE.NODE_261_length_1790_cov_102.780517_g234_i0~~NODE_261_length_1790_cov_102.780517_g234_i0.p1  ORF type:complete len:413 (-),score=50.40 NODE_261_length_1790_cov_102.780517_g234_i0:477-1715(-)
MPSKGLKRAYPAADQDTAESEAVAVRSEQPWWSTAHLQPKAKRPRTERKGDGLRLDTQADAEGEDEQEEEDEDEVQDVEIRHTNASVLAPGQSAGTLQIRPLAKPTHKNRIKNTIVGLDFSPTEPFHAAVAAARDNLVRIFDVAGDPKLKHTYNLQRHIWRAKYLPGGSQLFCMSMLSPCYIVDVEATAYQRFDYPSWRPAVDVTLNRALPSPDGNSILFLTHDGYIRTVSTTSFTTTSSIKLNNRAFDLAFDPANPYLLYVATTGIMTFDTRTQRPLGIADDEGNTRTLKLSLCRDWMITGAETGYLNVYQKPRGGDLDSLKLHKSLKNLTTQITTAAFDSASQTQLMAYSSGHKTQAVRVVHVPTFQIFPNWPKPGWFKAPVECLAWGGTPEQRRILLGSSNVLSHYAVG